MIISRGRRYVFVHIPKTGGTALATALETRAMADDILIGDTPKALRRKKRVKDITTAGRLWKHSRLADAEGLISRHEMQDLFTFTLVRNPWDRLVSYYHWLRGQDFEHPAVSLAQRVGFSTFLNDEATQQAIRQAPYGSYMCDGAGQEHCDLFIRLEHLGEDLAALKNHLGFDFDMPVVNASSRDADYRASYSDADAALVSQLAAEDIARFNYGFG
jgi:sulfotransferase famil protein